jgi:ribosomal-protein-alanine N-acetyltransferase
MVGKNQYTIRLTEDRDIRQIAEIDREAFSEEQLFRSYASYHREIHNPLARYIVACTEEEHELDTNRQIMPEPPWYKRLFSRNYHNVQHTTSEQYVFGFAGFWITPDEAHITALGVRNNYRRSGIGERLLISLIDLATQLSVRTITLEVRASNKAAQALYQKYGFQAVGRRPRYYSNNREDAVLMSTNTITSASFQAHFQELKEAHQQRWKESLIAA